MRIRIKQLLKAMDARPGVFLQGWVKTRRDSKGFSFIEMNDGSCLQNLQVVADQTLGNYDQVNRLTTGSSISVYGDLVESPGGGQQWELRAREIGIIQSAPESYPLQKKRHSDEYLRTIAHLRPRTNKYGAAFRVRSALSWAVHRFFQERDFVYVHTPILTGSDCEGAGELFQVTTLNLEQLPRSNGVVDYSADFFGRTANLTVSGQLSAEMFALALGDVYTFGPTFRAENSNTSRHAAEFWMIEPEMAFCDLQGNMEVAETFLQYLVQYALENCRDDLELFARFVDKQLLGTLETIRDTDFVRIPYREAVGILSKCGVPFEFPVEFGRDLQSEHERFLTEQHVKGPVILFDYPKTIKPFYMRLNDDGETVAAMDILVPGIGEIIGGSQREERLEVLEARMDAAGLPKEPYGWYLDSRRYGSVPHSGFGLGFERLIMLVTGINNIRDVIPFPRTPNHLSF
ncbi:MAG: asparagine--tRNA ligase [Thermodesulfobacteriota bacterium]